MTEGRWQVVLWDDDVNTLATVAFVLHRVVGLPLARSLELPNEVHEHGGASVGVYDDRKTAESVAARMQVFGVHSGVAPV